MSCEILLDKKKEHQSRRNFSIIKVFHLVYDYKELNVEYSFWDCKTNIISRLNLGCTILKLTKKGFERSIPQKDLTIFQLVIQIFHNCNTSILTKN